METTEMTLVKFDAPELQTIERSKAEQIKATFEPMAEMLAEFEEAFNTIIIESQEGITKEVTKKARRLRIDIARVRIETEKIRKEQKEEYLRAGKAIDGVSNILKWAVSDKENKLKEIENYFEIQEKKRKDELQKRRVEQLSPYVDDATERILSEMDEDVWEAFLAQKKKDYEDRIEAEKKAEQERIEKEKRDAEERERMRKENERLKKEAREREKLAKIEANKRAKEEAQRKAKEEKERKEREERERKEREEHEAKLKAAIEAKERVEREERIKREKLEAELKAKREAEKKAQEKEEAQFQAELSKNDRDKVNDLINDLNALKSKYTFDSARNQKMYNNVGILLNKIIVWINQVQQAEK